MRKTLYLWSGVLLGLLVAYQPSRTVLAQRLSSTTQYLHNAIDASPIGTAIGFFSGSTYKVASEADPFPVTISGAAGGSFTATQSGTWTMQPGNTANTTAWLVAGGKTSNAAVPGATNIGVLPCIANAAAPTLTETFQSGCSQNLFGAERIVITDPTSGAGVAIGVLDPCQKTAKTFFIVNISTATTVEIANAVSSQYFSICSVVLSATAAQTVAIGEDDTDGCGSITAGLSGGATAATGWSFVAGGGLTLGNGDSTVMRTATAARYLCIITGQAAQISGTIGYVSALP